MPRLAPAHVVVVTDASSTIGCALAQEHAIRGDAIVMAANDETLLDEPMSSCVRLGAWTHGVTVPNLGDSGMRALADSALQRFGRIDIWIQHALPSSRDSFSDIVPEQTLAALVSGARAATEALDSGDGGVLITLDGYTLRGKRNDDATSAMRAAISRVDQLAAASDRVTSLIVTSPYEASTTELAR